MNACLTLCMLAQAPATAPAPAPADAFLRSFLPLILIVGVFWWFMLRGRNKERQRFEQMLNALKRNDRVLTIGGIVGTVVEVRDHEIVLKVDEANNVKMRFVRSAIKEVLRDAPVADKEAAKT